MKRFAVFFAFLVFAYLCSVGVRWHQHTVLYAGQPEPVLSSADGYRWLRYAESYSEGPDVLSGLPEHAESPPEYPLISAAVSVFSGITGLVPQVAGSILTVFLSGLFIFPLGIFFYTAGFPAAGIGAGFSGALAFAYLSRTSAFQIDTDMLNLFFLSSGALFALMAERGRALLWSAVLGLTMYVFWRWYFHSGFTAAYFFLLLYALRRRELRVILVSAGVYIVCASPFVFVNGFRGLFEFFISEPGRSIASDVAELKVYGIADTLRRLNPVWQTAAVCIPLSLLAGRRAVYLAAFYLLGALAFFKGIRFAMFLAPLCGAGFAIVFDYIRNARKQALAYSVVAAVTVFSLSGHFSFVPQPVVSAETYAGLKMLKKAEKDSAVAAVWDHGFMVQYVTGLSVFADGATQYKKGAGVFAEAMMGTNPAESAGLLTDAAGDRPVYLLLTPDMDMKLGSLITAADMRISQELNEGSQDVILYPAADENAENGRNLFETVFFRLHVIGLSDMPCFERIYTNNHLLSIYRVQNDCRSEQ